MAERKTLRVQLPGEMPEGRETPTLVPILAVGMTAVPGGVCLMHKDTVAYPVGRSLAMYSPSQLPLVRMSEPLRSVRGITAVAVSPNKKFLAAAENMSDGYMPQVTLFDAATLERLASVTGPNVTSSYTSVSFSSNGSMLLAVGADDSRGTSTFHLWEWGASPQPRCSGTLGAGEGGPVLRAALDPRFDANVLVMCARDCGLWRQSPNGFKRHSVEGVELPPGASFVDLATLPDGRFLLATSVRQVLVVDRAHAHVAFTADRPLMSVLGLPDGSVAVGTERGYLQLYRRIAKDDHDHYAIFSETRVPESAQSVSLDAHIRAMSVDEAGDTLLCATAGGGPTYQFNLAYARTLALSPEASSDLWEMLLPGAHEQSIISASLAYKRDFLATASKDLTVRVWQTSPLRLVLTHMCHHSPLALSIDPYGRELVVAYVDGVRCYNIVEGLLVDGEDLRHEFGPANPGAAGATSTTAPPTAAAPGGAAAAAAASSGRRGAWTPAGSSLDHCSLVRYSPNGALIAAAAGPGGRHIYIYSTLTKRQVAVLTGHYEAVMDLVWSDDGAYLASTGEGAVFSWAMDGFVRVQENTSKLYLNDAISCTPDFHTLVVGDTTQGLRIMETLRAPASSAATNPGAAGTFSSGADGYDGAADGGGGNKVAAAFGKIIPVPGGGGGGGGNVTGSGGTGSVPDTPLFRVPGRASLMPLGADPATGGQGRSKMQAVTRITAMLAGGPPDAAAVAAAALAGSELKLRSNFQSIMQPSRGGLAIARCAPSSVPAGPGHSAAYPGYEAVIGTGVLGRVRVCPLRPRSNDDVDEYFLHAADVTQVVAHRDGRVVITTDASGCWIMNVLLPPGMSTASAAHSAMAMAAMSSGPSASGPSMSTAGNALASPARAGSPTRLSTAGGLLPGRMSTAHGLPGVVAALATHADRTALAHKLIRTVLAASEFSSYAATTAAKQAAQSSGSAAAAESGSASAQLIVSVRAVDVQLLKENVRELKDRLTKAATEAEYKMYEREQGVRRELEGDVGRLRNEVEVLRADLAYTRAAGSEEANTAERTKENMTRDFERALREQQDMFEKKLASEILRTDAAEKEMQRLRAKFGRKLWQLDEEHGVAMRDASDTQAVLETTIQTTKADAQKSIAAGHAQMQTELRIDGELNEEELQRAADAAQKQIEEKDEAYLKLLAKHTLQSGLSAKTAQENERLRAEADALRRENTRLAEQVMALTEELEAMQAAWADRDARQRQQDAEMKDMAFQMQQAQLFTSLATTRIKELNNELEPVRGARDEAQTHVAQMESVAQRQLERQAKVVSDNSMLQSRLDAANEELKLIKGELLERDAYFKNFTTQLFRTVQDVPHHQWPTLFGRMIEDYHRGRDKASWARYLESDHGPNAHPPGSSAIPAEARSGMVGGSATTAAEFNEKIHELHAQLMHTEKMLSLVTETKDKADKARRAVVSKLMADNLMVVQELNDTKRDLKFARELSEKRAIELADLRMSVAVAGGVGGAGLSLSQVASQASQVLLGGGPSGAGGGAGNGGVAGGSEALPQGPAGRAMSRLPSRLGDPSRHNAGGGSGGNVGNGSSGPGLASSPRSGDAGAVQGPSGPSGMGRSPAIPEHSSVSQAAPGPPPPPPPPMVVTGDMPQGGWWLGECSPFELPSSMDHLASNSLRRSLNSGSDATSGAPTDRPGTTALGGRRSGTTASFSAGGPSPAGGRGGFMPARTAFTPPTPHGTLPGPRPPTTSSSLVAAAVSGAALQAYSRQQQQQQQEAAGGQSDGAGSASGGGRGGGPSISSNGAAPPSPTPGGGSGPRAASAGPTAGSLASRNGSTLRSSPVSMGSPGHGPFGSAGHGSAASASNGGSGGGLSGSGYGGSHQLLQGQVRPSTPSKVTTMGAGFRSFVPTQHSGSGGRGNSR